MPKHELKNPRLPDPVGFSRAIEAPRGRTIYLAGQVPAQPDGQVAGKGDMRVQAQTVMEKLKDIMEANGGRMDDIVKLTFFVTDITQMEAVRQVRTDYFTAPYPAMTGVQIDRLASPDFLIEVDGVAVVEEE